MVRIIPVLDLKGGEVVRAEKGQRDRYRPMVTPLAASSDPVAVAEGLRTLFPFGTFYIADLDAIEGRPPNHDALARLRRMQDEPELWLDAGFAEAASLDAALARRGSAPCLVRNRRATMHCSGAPVIIPVSSCRSIFLPTGSAARRLFSTKPSCGRGASSS